MSRPRRRAATPAERAWMRAVGQRIREARQGRGLSLEALGQHVGASQMYLSYLERGMLSDLSTAILRRLAVALGLDLATLLEPPSSANITPQETATRKKTAGTGRPI